MKRALILAAAMVVVVSNVWVLLSARHNRSDARGGTVELTERELGLPPMIGDSTAILLELQWDAYPNVPEGGRSPEWLNVAKLAELGFDCHVPVTSPDARGHYSSRLSVPAYVVLEYEGEAWRSSGRDRGVKTHLFAVDAGREPHRLRQKYPDPARYIIVRAVVRAFLQERSRQDGTPLAQPRLRGWLETVPNQVFVPQPHSKSLQRLRRHEGRTEKELEGEPRFAVTVSWGAGYEPWVQGVRMLPATDSALKRR